MLEHCECTAKGYLVQNVRSPELEKTWTRPRRVFRGPEALLQTRKRTRGSQHGGTPSKSEPSKLPNLPLPRGQGEEEGATSNKLLPGLVCSPKLLWERVSERAVALGVSRPSHKSAREGRNTGSPN